MTSYSDTELFRRLKKLEKKDGNSRYYSRLVTAGVALVFVPLYLVFTSHEADLENFEALAEENVLLERELAVARNELDDLSMAVLDMESERRSNIRIIMNLEARQEGLQDELSQFLRDELPARISHTIDRLTLGIQDEPRAVLLLVGPVGIREYFETEWLELYRGSRLILDDDQALLLEDGDKFYPIDSDVFIPEDADLIWIDCLSGVSQEQLSSIVAAEIPPEFRTEVPFLYFTRFTEEGKVEFEFREAAIEALEYQGDCDIGVMPILLQR